MHSHGRTRVKISNVRDGKRFRLIAFQLVTLQYYSTNGLLKQLCIMRREDEKAITRLLYATIAVMVAVAIAVSIY